MEQIKPEIRTFLIGAVVLSTNVWGIAFNLGTYRTIFFDEIFTAWVTVTALGIAIFLLPSGDAPIPWWGRVLIFLPTLAIFAAYLDRGLFDGMLGNWIAILFGAFAIVVCLPYAIYVAIEVLDSDLLALPDFRLKIALLVIPLIVGIMGFYVGHNNHEFMTCGDFKISGNDLPQDCRQGPPLQY